MALPAAEEVSKPVEKHGALARGVEPRVQTHERVLGDSTGPVRAGVRRGGVGGGTGVGNVCVRAGAVRRVRGAEDGGGEGGFAADGHSARGGESGVELIEFIARVGEGDERGDGGEALSRSDSKGAASLSARVRNAGREREGGDGGAEGALRRAGRWAGARGQARALETVQTLRHGAVAGGEAVRLGEEHEEGESLILEIQHARERRTTLHQDAKGVHQRGAERGDEPVRGDELEEGGAGVARVHLELHAAARPESWRAMGRTSRRQLFACAACE